jgi:hypothetical protein
MQNERFESAARSRRAVALTIALLFHLGLLAWVVVSEQRNDQAAAEALTAQTPADATTGRAALP